MKSITGLLLFLLLNVIISNKIKVKSNSKSITSNPGLFKLSKATACSKAKLLRRIRDEILEEREAKWANGRRGRNPKFFWVKQWGYGSAAYLFDYFDPIFRDLVANEMHKMFQTLKTFPTVDRVYKDPFDFKKMITQDSTSLNSKLMKQLKLFTENYDPQVYDLSANAVQIRKAMLTWKWNVDRTLRNFPSLFVKRFDMNSDGRLNPREVVLGSIIHNRGVIGTQLCEYCYNNSTMIMDSIFLYLDCNDDGWLSAEEFWHNLQNVNRDSEEYNLYSFGVSESIRTAAVNDFIIKNSKTRDGYVTKEEFRQGLLLGFWDRQTEKTEILLDDSRTMKTLRWTDDDTVDIKLYEYYKQKMRLEM